MAAVLEISANIPINHIMPKTIESFGYIFVADFSEMTQNNDHYAIQVHSRSPISVQTGCPNITSYNLVLVKGGDLFGWESNRGPGGK